jgi:hypothetical protein
MSYLNEMVARSIAEERQRDALITLRHQQQAAERARPTTATVSTPRHHGRWHVALVRLHVLHSHTP